MREYIGPQQRRILVAIAGGAELWKSPGNHGYSVWRLGDATANREACMALYLRGYFMGMGVEGDKERFVLTDKGRAAL